MIDAFLAWTSSRYTKRFARLNAVWTSALGHSRRIRILQVAKGEVGNGEIGSNNRGRHVTKYRGRAKGGPWCASLVGWVLEQAYDGKLEFKRSHVAKKLFRQIAKHGRALDPGERPMPGDIFCKHRGKNEDGSWKWTGHIGFVETVHDGYVEIIDGNRGKFPAPVRRGILRFDDPELLGFARL